jgi:hypothetical protein
MPESTVWLKRSAPLSAETQPPRVSKDITILNVAKRKNVFLSRSNRLQFYRQSSAFFTDEHRHLSVDSVEGSPGDDYSPKTETNQPPFGPFEGCVPMWRVIVGFTCVICSAFMIGSEDRLLSVIGVVLFVVGSLIWLTGHTPGNCSQASNGQQGGYYQIFHADTRYDSSAALDNRFDFISGGAQ